MVLFVEIIWVIGFFVIIGSLFNQHEVVMLDAKNRGFTSFAADIILVISTTIWPLMVAYLLFKEFRERTNQG